MDPGRVVPLFVEVGECGAVVRGFVVQQPVGVPVGAVEQGFGRAAPGSVPVGLHLAEIATADTAGGKHNGIGSRLEVAVPALENPSTADDATRLGEEALDSVVVEDLELVAVGMVVEGGHHSLDDAESGAPCDVPTRDRVPRAGKDLARSSSPGEERTRLGSRANRR